MFDKTDAYFLALAYQEAQLGLKAGGIPIGAVLVINNEVVAKGHNKRIQEHSMIKHGETDCLENTKRQIPPEKMQQATLYTTLSPCYMCAGAILLNKIPKVVVGENKTFEQSETLLKDKGVTVVVINDQKFIDMMLDFIIKKPKMWGEDIGLKEQQTLDKYKNIAPSASSMSSTEKHTFHPAKCI
jgi:cytosine/creatinine deaminase